MCASLCVCQSLCVYQSVCVYAYLLLINPTIDAAKRKKKESTKIRMKWKAKFGFLLPSMLINSRMERWMGQAGAVARGRERWWQGEVKGSHNQVGCVCPLPMPHALYHKSSQVFRLVRRGVDQKSRPETNTHTETYTHTLAHKHFALLVINLMAKEIMRVSLRWC